jgi:hypothetical protein
MSNIGSQKKILQKKENLLGIPQRSEVQHPGLQVQSLQ